MLVYCPDDGNTNDGVVVSDMTKLLQSHRRHTSVVTGWATHPVNWSWCAELLERSYKAKKKKSSTLTPLTVYHIFLCQPALIADNEMYQLKFIASVYGPVFICWSKPMMHVYKNENSQFACIESATKPFVWVWNGILWSAGTQSASSY